MILRLQQHLAFIFVIVLNIIHAKSDSTFDCRVTVENIKFDLTSLSGEHVIHRTRETPPTTTVDSLIFNPCKDLEHQDNLSEQDQVRFALKYQSMLGSRVPHDLAMNFIKSSVHLKQDSV